MSKIFYFLVSFFLLSSVIAEEVPKLTVSGEAILYKPADQLSFNIGVTTFGKEAEYVLAENSQKLQRIIDELEKNGLTKSEFKTNQFTLHPTYTPQPKNPPPDWKPSINGYEITHMIQIKTDKINQIGNFIDVASRAGANKIDHIQASLKDERIYWSDAITTATKNAIADATVMTNAANVHVVRLLSLTLNDAHVKPPQPLAPTYFRAMAAGAENTPIEPGDIEIRANVTAVFEIGIL